MDELISTITCLTENLLQENLTDYEGVIDKLFSEVSALDSFLKIPDPQFEQCAIQLWNWAVTKNVGNAITEIQKAKVRHVACNLLYCYESDSPTEGAIQKQILMAKKAGRTWLNCKNFQMADHFLRLAVKSLETLYAHLMSRANEAPGVSSSKADVEKDLLQILSCQAESAMAQGNNQEAIVFIKRCKDILLRLPNETAYLSLMCYNIGLEAYSLTKFEDGVFWLRESYDIGKANENYGPGSEAMAKILRLLATCYFEWDCEKFQEKALNAVSLANKEYVTPLGLFLKIRILLRCRAPDSSVRAGLNEILELKVSLDVCLETVRLLMSKDREVLAFEYLETVCQHFESSPNLGTALVLHIELLLQRGMVQQGRQKIKDVITGHYAGKQLAPEALKSLHVMLWDQASKHVEVKNYSEALQWLDYSLSFFKAGQIDSNLSKLQRNRATCFLKLKQLEKAKEAAKEAERCDPHSIFTQFIVYKIYVQESDAEKAAEALSVMSLLSKKAVFSKDRLLATETAASYLFSLAAQNALENGQQETAIKALEVLCENTKEEALILTALRCLVRLVLSTNKTTKDLSHLDVLLSYLKMALQAASCQSLTVEQRTDQANWFHKTAWNLALQCESKPDRMRDFYVLSYQLSQLCPPDRTLLMGQRTCLLMAVDISLSLFGKSPHSAQTEELTQALEYIQTCWEVWKTLKASGSFPNDPTESLLLLYEFETRAKLNDPKVETILESVLELETVETKVLESMAALAMEPPAHFPVLCKKALRVSLSLHKKQPQMDLDHCSKIVHTLIKLSLPSGVSEVGPQDLEEVWDYFQEDLSIITAAPDDFAEMETVWLLTHAWNTGLLLYNLTQYTEAEKWFGLAMRFVRYLRSQRESYEKMISSRYSEILERLDAAKRNRH
ncbi:testis-expressed protein 11 [Oryzias melastigma]|nr:testis-expressed protein 11 [Oryzias melastigma]